MQRLGIDVADVHPGTGSVKALRDGRADPAGASRYQNSFIGQIHAVRDQPALCTSGDSFSMPGRILSEVIEENPRRK